MNKPISASEPQKTEEKKPTADYSRSPRYYSCLMLGAGLCTTLGYIASAGPKIPPFTGE